MTGPRPSAAIPSHTLTRPQTIRFKETVFTQPRTKRFSSATTAKPSVKTAKRSDSHIPPDVRASTQETPPRKGTAASLFQSRSWSIFWDPRFCTTTDDEQAEDATISGDTESCKEGAGEGKRRHSFISRCKNDKLLHVVLGMVVIVGGGLIIAGVVWSVTHSSRVMEDTRDFVCGKGVAGGPKCAVHLKGDKSSVGSADWVGGEVVDWWLKNHCVWRGKEEEWWCGSQIGQKEGAGDQVLPEGTWLEKTEEEEAEGEPRTP
jgi:hypothetical protein